MGGIQNRKIVFHQFHFTWFYLLSFFARTTLRRVPSLGWSSTERRQQSCAQCLQLSAWTIVGSIHPIGGPPKSPLCSSTWCKAAATAVMHTKPPRMVGSRRRRQDPWHLPEVTWRRRGRSRTCFDAHHLTSEHTLLNNKQDEDNIAEDACLAGWTRWIRFVLQLALSDV